MYDSPAKSQPASQNARARQREKHYNMNILKKITVDDRDTLLKEIKHGRNTLGGTYGMNEGTFDSSRSGGGSRPQKYNHSQKSPMIIRGA